jgi:hypothetical protein
VAGLFYPTKYRGKGPWLIESSQLLSLDQSIDEYLVKSKAASASTTASVATDSSNQDSSVRTITFRLRHDKELETSSFRDALFHPAAINENALGLKYEVKVRDITALLVLEKNTKERAIKQTNWTIFDTEENETELQITVEPKSAALSQELFAVLKDWAVGVQPPIWQKWVLNFRGFGRLALFFWLLLLGVFFFSPTPPNLKEHYKQEARKLLDKGIDSNNQQKALELLLAIYSDYVPPSAKPVPTMLSSRSLITNLLGLFAVSVVAFFPELCIGLWRGKQYLRWWRTWVRFVSVTVPGLLVARYFWPQLFNLVEKALGH